MRLLCCIALGTYSLGGFSANAVSTQNALKEGEIVVTGRTLEDTERALNACLERQCPPDEDVKATLDHAENQFVAGEYKSARSTVLSSLKRNRKHRKAYPVDVSDLYHVNATIAEHLGEVNTFRFSIIEMRDTLKKGIPANDPRILIAEMEVADSRLKLGYPEEARRKYLAIEKVALDRELPKISALARLRYLSSLVRKAQISKSKLDWKTAGKALDRYIAKPTKGAEIYGTVTQILKARLDRSFGKTETSELLISQLAQINASSRPILIAADPIKPNQASVHRAFVGGTDLNRLSMSDVDNVWVDIGFWITPEGKISELEILRASGNTNWVRPVLEHIESRIYSGSDDQNSPGFYTVERYSLTADWQSNITGTRLRQRSPIVSIKRLDLSIDDQ